MSEKKKLKVRKHRKKESENRMKRPKESLQILNSREKKELNRKIEEQWGVSFDKEMVFLRNNKDKIYLAQTSISSIDIDNLRIDSIGLYVCTDSEKGIRLSIEGSQIIGPKAKKNIVTISPDDLQLWLRGNDLPMIPDSAEGAVIIRCGDDFAGCGKVTGKGILNFVPKTRRIQIKRR